MEKITPFLWFKKDAEKAAEFYTKIFRDSRILRTTHYTKETEEVSGKPAGSVMTVEFEIEGQTFTAINGGEPFQLSEAVSFVINCKDQEEIDYYWDMLTSGGDPSSQVCGWLKDKYGLSWQVVPANLPELIGGDDTAKNERAMAALLKMKKLDMEALKNA